MSSEHTVTRSGPHGPNRTRSDQARSDRAHADRTRPNQARSDLALRRALRAACAALLVAAVVTGCGTAQGALRAEVTPGPSWPTAPSPTAAPATPTAPAPSRASASPTASGSGPAAPGSAPPTSPGPSNGPSVPAVPKPAPTATPAPPPATAAPVQPPAGTGVSAALVATTAHGGRTVALTFDDGPGPATGQVLDVLAQYGAKATFCQIGPQAAANPAVVKRILAAGHRLCDHSVHHPQPFAALSHDRQVQEIATAKDMIVRAGGAGTEVPWFRAPGGGFTAANQQVAASYGMRPLTWTVDTRDWTRPGAPAIVASVQRALRPGGVVLMHDGGGDRTQTVAALRQLLPWLTAQGYAFDFPAV
ncbi:polysaccharide deacetylase family protein [Kitasatospora sp. NPDC057015]|uniref:polysaccharide deacetylase family protein n=1 Tax=Kitasatospora sp. NPDC057015 TaxID=3346001 RepID=UPI003633CAB3